MKSNVSKFLIKSVLSAAIISTLNSCTISAVENQKCCNSECVICLNSLNDLKNPKPIKILPCKHGFCKRCIDNWLEYSEHPKCPLCRRDIPVRRPKKQCFICKKRLSKNVTTFKGCDCCRTCLNKIHNSY